MIQDIPARTKELIGRAGVHLAMFHLCRLGHECAETIHLSARGDLWVDFGDGPEAVEVKAASGSIWTIKLSQLRRVKRLMLVHVDDGQCWMFNAAEVLSCLEEKVPDGSDTRAVSLAKLNKCSKEVLHRKTPPVCQAAPRKDNPKPRFKRDGTPAMKRVVRKLVNGETKIYEYPLR
jgi:hypothetical protein